MLIANMTVYMGKLDLSPQVQKAYDFVTYMYNFAEYIYEHLDLPASQLCKKWKKTSCFVQHTNVSSSFFTWSTYKMDALAALGVLHLQTTCQ